MIKFRVALIVLFFSSLSMALDIIHPGFERVDSEQITPADAHQVLLGNLQASSQLLTGGQSLMMGNPAQATPEIEELARGLMNDPNLMYKFVHDHIEYTPIFGDVKGAYMTLMDRSGNSFDQSSLLIALLREAGFTANYVYGVIRLTDDQVTSWLGVPDDPYVVYYLLSGAGIPVQVYTDGGGGLSYVDLDHVWVKVNIGGTDYVFDPSFKEHTIVSGIDLSTATGYNQSSFMSSATTGATIATDYIQDINKPNIEADLTSYSSNLINYINTNIPDATLEEVIGGKLIVPASSIPSQTSLPYQQSITSEWTDIPNTFKTSLRIQHRSIDETVYSSDVYGRRLTIFYNGSNQPVLSLDGQTIATGIATTPDTYNDIIFTIDHPYAALGGTYCDRTNTYSLLAGGSYSIISGWAKTDTKIIEKHRRILAENIYNGGTDESEEVMGESLSILGLTWLAENSAIDRFCSQVTETSITSHHTIGICGQKNSPYIDIQSLVNLTNHNNDTTQGNACFFTGGGFKSAFENGVIEQLQPDHNSVSTVDLIDISNGKSDKIFDANSTNYYSTIKSQLTNYDSYEFSYVEAYIDAGYRVILPQDGNLGKDSWAGIGFLAVAPDNSTIVYIISGGYNGGYGSADWILTDIDIPIAEPTELTSYDHSFSWDPIDLVNGNYIYKGRDLAIGSGGWPFSLDFTRHYNSDDQLNKTSLGLGWRSNFDIVAKAASDGFQSMGLDSPLDSVAAIVAAYVTTDLFETNSTNQAMVTATLTHEWFMEQLISNVVIVSQPGNTMQFVKLPDGSFNPPPGKKATLTVEPDGSYLLENKHKQYLDFDTDGKIASWYDPNNTVTFTYTSGKLSQVSNGFSRYIDIVYDGNNIDYITDSASRTVDYTYDANDNLISAVDVNGFTTTYSYDPNNDGRMTKLFYPANPANPYMINEYDSLGQVKTQTNANGDIYNYYYTDHWTTETDPCGFSHKYFFDKLGKTIAEQDKVGNLTQHELDGHLRKTRTILPMGNSIEYEYDSNHNVSKITKVPVTGSSEPNIVENFTYDPNFNKVLTYTDPNSNTTTYSYDDNGHLKTITYPTVDGNTAVISYTYNDDGQIKTETNADGIITKYEYAPTTADMIKKTIDYGTDPENLNIITEMTYNAYGDVNSITDPLGNISLFEYNPLRKLKQTTSPAPFNYITKYEYDENGNLEYLKQETRDSNHPWLITSYTYTLTDKEETITDPNGNMIEYEYDGLDRIWTIIDANGNITEKLYYPDGKLKLIIDAEDHNSVSYTYTANGDIETIADANDNTTTYSYDDFGRLEIITYPDDSNEIFGYDERGNTTAKTLRNGQTINYSYDELSRLETKTLPGSNVITYSYDIANRITDINEAGDVIHNDYDRIGRLEMVSYPSGKTVSYEYDDAGNRKKLTYPDSTFITYYYDEMNRLTDINDYDSNSIVNYAYDALSRRETATYANGAEISYDYDTAGRLLNLDNQINGSTNKTYGYTYDPVGNRLTMTVDGADVHSYVYDKINQLTNVDYPAGYFANDTAFNYDAVMNRGTVNDGTATDYSVNSLNQYTTVGGTSLSYDNNGNLTDDGTNKYYYDSRNRLTDVNNQSDAPIASYKYDDLGRRIEKTVHGSPDITTKYLYDGDQVICEYDNYNRLMRKFVYGTGIDEAVRMTNVWPSADIVDTQVIAFLDSLENEYFAMAIQIADKWLNEDSYTIAEIYAQNYFMAKLRQSGDIIDTIERRIIGSKYPNGTMPVLQLGMFYEPTEPDSVSTIINDAQNNRIIEIIKSNDGKTRAYVNYYPNVVLVKIVYFDASNDIENLICVTYDNNGQFISMEDVFAQLAAESSQGDSSPGGGGGMMDMGEGGSVAVDFVDFAAMANTWLLDGGDAGFDPNAELNFDNAVDVEDLAILAEYWLTDGVRADEHYYYHYDGLGSVVVLSDEAGNIVEEYNYDVFGTPNTTSSVGNSYMFTGRRYDVESGLYYYRARMYNPSLGRFMQVDAIGYDDGMNIYAYVGNNPINLVDFLGLCSEQAQWSAVEPKWYDNAVTRKIYDGLDFTFGSGIRATQGYAENIKRNVKNLIFESSYGLDLNLATVQPFTSRASGNVIGVNKMWGKADGVYKYSSAGRGNAGFDLGIAGQIVLAKGSGNWSGKFDATTVNLWYFTASVFRSPEGEGNWSGITFGLGAGVPVGYAEEHTTYSPLVE